MTSNTLNELIAEGVRGRYILVRSDLNVPLDGSTVTDDGRIKASLPVLSKLTDAGARVLVTAHLGRPKGAPEDKYSLRPAVDRLAELAGFGRAACVAKHVVQYGFAPTIPRSTVSF